MKKKISTIIILSLCAVYLSVMPVMAKERTTTDQGLSITYPDTYNCYSKDEYLQMREEEVRNGADTATDFAGNVKEWGFWKRIVYGLANEALAGAITNDSIQEDADDLFADDADFIISKDTDTDVCSVYKVSEKMTDLSYWSCYDIQKYLFSDDNGRINKFLKESDYTCNPEDAVIVEPSNGNTSYIQISGTSSDSSQSYILTEFIANGYEYRIFLEYNGTIPSEAKDAYNGIINSATIAYSPNEPESPLKYDSILKSKVELID